MALKIRLRQQGKTNRLTYRLVLTEDRSSRDGKYVEMLGWYNPHEKTDDKQLHIESERVRHWLNQGAILTDKSAALLKRVAPEVIKEQTAKRVAKRLRTAAKRKEK
jgi:small subunit ribosomal protein S16